MKVNKLYDFFVLRPFDIDKNIVSHRQTLKKGFISATIYSILYGIYEYFVVYTRFSLIDTVFTPQINWLIMYLGIIITVGLVTKVNIEQIIFGLFYMIMFEDVVYWIGYGIDFGIFPYPAANWWDIYLASFRVLGGFGRAVPFWPYVPLYYFPGFGIVILYYILSYRSALLSRIMAWIIAPFFISIIAGALGNDLTATILIILIPLILYLYIIILSIIRRRRRKRQQISFE